MIGLKKLKNLFVEGLSSSLRADNGEAKKVFDRQGGSPLTEADEGFDGKIVDVVVESPRQRRQLMLIGALPGNRVSVEQTSPAYVVFVEDMRFALDYELADRIVVN